MREFDGRVAVVTGGASGIGRALCERFLRAGMRVVVADVEEAALAAAEKELSSGGGDVLAVRTDVSKAADVEALASAAYSRFGSVHVLCNNAGVGFGRSLLETTPGDWQWVLGVNLWGVVHGVRAFVPRMKEAGVEGHVVNTASICGLISLPGAGVYTVSKYGVVAISETLAVELAAEKSPIGVSVLCPAAVATNITSSERNRPRELDDAPAPTAEDEARSEEIRAAIAAGMNPRDTAERVFGAIESGEFYILTHPEANTAIEARFRAVLEGKAPAVPEWE